MDPERWKRIDALLSAALECQEAERASFLARACEGDEELRKEVQGLLSEREAAGSFLQTPLADAAEMIASARPAPGATELDERGGAQVDRTLPSEGGVGALEQGSTLSRYIVLNKLGGGGMGVVYTAYDPELDRKVAVKLLRPEAAEGHKDPRAQERLLREAQAMARLSHPNVIPVYDVGTLGEQIFIAMELVEGQTLAQWLKETERSAREVLDVFIQAGKGLAAAHAAGLVHRDFKPENVLIGRDGQVKVLDFGLARAAKELASGAPTLPPEIEARGTSTPRVLAAHLTRTGAFLGTPAYMAPEQLLGKTTDTRTDQFSFCVALHEALYGERPFEGSSVEALAQKVTKGEVKEPPKSTRIPGRVRQILLRGLRPNPHERYPSMEVLLKELSKDPRAKRRRALAVGSAVLALAVIGIGYRQAYRHSQVCKGAEKKLAGVWDDNTKRVVSAALLATGKPYASDAVRGVQKALDAYTQSWAAMHTEACEATWIRGEQSEELLDLRMDCLSQRRDELQSLVQLLSKADAKLAEGAVQASQRLGNLDICSNATALKAPVRPPADSSARLKVEELRKTLANAKALRAAGKFPEGLPIATSIAAEAKTLGYRPFEAEALLLAGQLKYQVRDFKGAERELDASVLAAEAGRNDETAAVAWTQLIAVLGSAQARYEEGHKAEEHALAAIERLGGRETLLASLLYNSAVLLRQEGKYEDALAQHRRALAIQERVLGPEHLDVATSLSNLSIVLVHQGKYEEALAQVQHALAIEEAALGATHPNLSLALHTIGSILGRQGKYQEALPYLQRALAVRELALGPEHPSLAPSLNNLGNIFALQKKSQEALGYYQRALAMNEKALGPNHPEVARPLLGIGSVYLETHAPGKALAPLERAVSIWEGRPGDPVELAQARFELARALWETGGDRKRAKQLAALARTTFGASGERARKELAEVDDWLSRTR
jgi:tetratricopeptide (TPR) repeat protein/predicted Ser/Thr protein kinase